MDCDYDKLILGIVIAGLSIISTLIFIYGNGVLTGVFGTSTAILAFILICANATLE